MTQNSLHNIFFLLRKKYTQDVFCWWRSPEFISFSLGGTYFLSVSCQPSKAWNAVTALYSKPDSYGLAILWLTMYWRFATQCWITVKHHGCQSICCLALLPCSKEKEDVRVYFQLHRRWQRLRYLPYFVCVFNWLFFYISHSVSSLIILSTILIFSSRTTQCNKDRIRKWIKNEAASGWVSGCRNLAQTIKAMLISFQGKCIT